MDMLCIKITTVARSVNGLGVWSRMGPPMTYVTCSISFMLTESCPHNDDDLVDLVK